MVHPKNVLLSLFAHSHVVPNLYSFLSCDEDILKIVGNETFLFANNKDKIMILKNVKVEPLGLLYIIK